MNKAKLIQEVNCVLKCTQHPTEDEWFVKKVFVVSGEWEEDFGSKWRPLWARHLPAKRWEYYHPNPIELLIHQALNNWSPPERGDTILNVENLNKNNDELLEDLKKKRNKCNGEFALASVEFKRRKFWAGLIAVFELVKQRNNVAQAVEFEKLKHSVPKKEEYLDGLIQADRCKLFQPGLQDFDWEDKRP